MVGYREAVPYVVGAIFEHFLCQTVNDLFE